MEVCDLKSINNPNSIYIELKDAYFVNLYQSVFNLSQADLHKMLDFSAREKTTSFIKTIYNLVDNSDILTTTHQKIEVTTVIRIRLGITYKGEDSVYNLVTCKEMNKSTINALKAKNSKDIFC